MCDLGYDYSDIVIDHGYATFAENDFFSENMFD